MLNYEKIKKVAKYSHFVGAGLLFITSVMRLFTLNFKAIEVLLSIYYVLFGLIIIMSELKYQRVLTHFYFMNFSFGKAIFAGFIATMVFSFEWIQLATFVFFLVACCGFIVLGVLFSKQEIAEVTESPSSVPPEGNKGTDGQKETEKKDSTPQVNLPAPYV